MSNTNTIKASFAVIGHTVDHSRSPAIHSAFAQQTGITLQYDRLDAAPASFETTVADFFANGGQGLNVTVPFKERAWQLPSQLKHTGATRRRGQHTLVFSERIAWLQH